MLAGASGSTGETGASGQTGLTGVFWLWFSPFRCMQAWHAIRAEEGCDTM